MNVIMEDLHSIVEWQCAHDALNHAMKGNQITLSYETPDGELTLFVLLDGENVFVSKKDFTVAGLTTKG